MTAAGSCGSALRHEINLAAIDDDRMLLDGLASWLAKTPDLRLVAAVTTVDELLAGTGRHASVVLLDMRLRDSSDPVENVRRLITANKRVLVVGAFDACDNVADAIRAGARGYLTKSHDLASLASAIREVAAGGTFLSPELAFSLIRNTQADRPVLSRQERAIVIAYASGMTLQTAARKVGITVGTAKEYLDRVKLKYGAVGRPTHTKLDLAARMREDGIFSS